MGTRADEIRHDIERTRADLGATIDEVGDRVSPKQMARRGKDRTRQRFRDAKDRVMGSAGSAKDRVKNGAGSAREKVMGSAEEAPHQMQDQIQGNPLAAGLIAFGAGALLASMLPGDRTSREAAQALSEKAGPMVDRAKAEVKEAGGAMGENVSRSAKDSAHHLQDQARESAEHVKQDAKASGEHMKEESRRASENVEEESRRS